MPLSPPVTEDQERGEIIRPAPIPPSLTDFGLSQKALESLPKTFFVFFWDQYGAESHLNHSRITIYVIAHTIAFFSVFYHEGMEINFPNIAGFAGFGFLFIIPFMILTAIAGRIEKSVLSEFNQNFRKHLQFLAACAAYQNDKRQYDRETAERAARVLRKQEEYWRSLSGVSFEREIGNLFSLMGYDVTLTPHTGDGGVDICLKKNEKLTVVQCKAHGKRIPIGVARELCASMVDFGADNAIIACFEGVTKPVEDYIKGKPITVLKLGDIVTLQRRYG